MNCPFCNEKLVSHFSTMSMELYCCDNQKCSKGGVATIESWQYMDKLVQELKQAKQS